MAEPGAAHGQRHREPDRLALLADQLAEPRGDMDIRRRQHPDVVELAQQPGRAHSPPRLERIGERAHRWAPIEHVAQRFDKRTRRPPREHARIRLAGHASNEQVEHAGQMAVRRVPGQPPAQIPVQRDRVQQRLQPVVRATHLLCQHVRSVVRKREWLARWAEPVRLVVDDGEPRGGRAPNPRHEVDAPGEESPDLRPQRRVLEARGVSGHRIVG